MKKIIYIISLVFLLISINECSGYKPIFSSSNLEFEINDYNLEGDRILDNKIYSKLFNLSRNKKNNQSARSVDVSINTEKNKSSMSKDNTGKILEYKIGLVAKIIVTDSLTDALILNKNFSYSLNYKTQGQYSDTVKLENSTVENLVNKIFQDLLIDLSHNLTKK